MALRKVNCVSQLDHTTEKVGPGSESLDDAGDLLPASPFAPEVIGRSGLAGGFGVFDDPDLRRWFRRLLVAATVSHTCPSYLPVTTAGCRDTGK